VLYTLYPVFHREEQIAKETQFFTAWVVVAIIWLWLTMLMVIFYPLIDGGIEQIGLVFRRSIQKPDGKRAAAESTKENVEVKRY